MSTGAVKGIEVLLIAGAVFWFAYSQLNALKQTKPTDTDKAGSAKEEQDIEDAEGDVPATTRSPGND